MLQIADIRAMASDKKAKVRREATRTLKVIAKENLEEVISALNGWMGEDNELLRQTSVLAAGEIFKEKRGVSLSFFSKASRDGSWRVREAVARSLAEMVPIEPRALEMLEDLADDEASIVNRSVGDAIAEASRVASFDAIPIVERLASSDDVGRRKTAAFALRNLERGDRRMMPLLRRFAREGPKMKWTAVYACKLIGRRKREEALEIIESVRNGEELEKMIKAAVKEIRQSGIGR